MNGSLYHEVQKMRQPWLWLLLGSGVLVSAAVLGWGLWQQLVLGRPWGNHPLPDGALLVIAGAVAVLHGGIILLLFVSRLETTVRPSELRVQFHPLHRRPRIFRRDQIASFEERTYRPIREYGGWGIRFGPRGRAYNASGNRGVELTLRDGSHVMIGSLRPEELAQALTAAGF